MDAVIVLCAGVLTGEFFQEVCSRSRDLGVDDRFGGILGACELFERMARDRLLPQWFARRLPLTHAPVYSICAFSAFSYALYATSGGSLAVVSKMCAVVSLGVAA